MDKKEFLKLAGVTSLRENKSWTLYEEPSFVLGDTVQATEDAGTDSGKQGKVLTIDGEWAQVLTNRKELFWLPHAKLAPVERIK